MMTFVRAVVGAAVIALCAGFMPVSGCAKGCGSAGKVGASHADDFARVGRVTHVGDDMARVRGVTHYGEDLARVGGGRNLGTVGVMGHVDDIAPLTKGQLDATLDNLAVSGAQKTKIMDALEYTQDLLDPLSELLASDDEEATATLKVEAAKLDIKLRSVLTDAQRELLHQELGSAEAIALRLAKDRPITRGSDKVAP
jgi:hypothetical protein